MQQPQLPSTRLRAALTAYHASKARSFGDTPLAFVGPCIQIAELMERYAQRVGVAYRWTAAFGGHEWMAIMKELVPKVVDRLEALEGLLELCPVNGPSGALTISAQGGEMSMRSETT